MSDIPTELKYVTSHEWVRDEGDGTVTIGITDFAQQQLGDVVFIELPTVGNHYSVEDEFGVIESVKAASDLYAPLTGEVIAINAALEDDPEMVNSLPYEAWICRMRPVGAGAMDALLDAVGYAEVCAE